MAKRKGRRKMGRYLRGPVDEDMALGTLASKDVVAQVFGSTVNERTLISSIVATYSMEGFTPGDDIGPIMVGVSHGDYTAAEIEEFLEGTAGWNEGDKIALERANRKIRRIGVFEDPSSANQSVTLNDGRPIKTKLNWILNQGITLDVWAYNMGAQPLATTNPNVHVQGHANLWPGK